MPIQYTFEPDASYVCPVCGKLYAQHEPRLADPEELSHTGKPIGWKIVRGCEVRV